MADVKTKCKKCQCEYSADELQTMLVDDKLKGATHEQSTAVCKNCETIVYREVKGNVAGAEYKEWTSVPV